MNTERDEFKQKYDLTESKNLELQTKISNLHEKNEKYIEENTKIMERRYETYAEEQKQKNLQIMELQQSMRKFEYEAQQAKQEKLEAENKVLTLNRDLETEKVISANVQDLQRQVALLTVQLEQSNAAITDREHQAKVQLSQQLSERDSQLELIKKNLNDSKIHFDHERNEMTANLSSVKDTLTSLQASSEKQIQSLSIKLTEATATADALRAESDRYKLQFEQLNAQYQQSLAVTADLKSQVESLESELASANSRVEEVVAEARSRITSRDAVIATLEQAKVDEYERGQQETIAEIRPQIESIKSKGKAAIDQLIQERTDLESRIQSLEEENAQLVEKSQAYVEKMTTAFKQKMAELEESSNGGGEVLSEEKLAEVKKDTLTTLYAGLVSALQQRQQPALTPSEIVTVLRAEMTAVMSGQPAQYIPIEPTVESEHNAYAGDEQTTVSTEPPAPEPPESVPIGEHVPHEGFNAPLTSKSVVELETIEDAQPSEQSVTTPVDEAHAAPPVADDIPAVTPTPVPESTTESAPPAPVPEPTPEPAAATSVLSSGGDDFEDMEDDTESVSLPVAAEPAPLTVVSSSQSLATDDDDVKAAIMSRSSEATEAVLDVPHVDIHPVLTPELPQNPLTAPDPLILAAATAMATTSAAEDELPPPSLPPTDLPPPELPPPVAATTTSVPTTTAASKPITATSTSSLPSDYDPFDESQTAEPVAPPKPVAAKSAPSKPKGLFGDDDDSVGGGLFASTKPKAAAPKKSSLFGDDDDEDPLFK